MRRTLASLSATALAVTALAIAAPAADARRTAPPVIAVANGTVGMSQAVSVLAPSLANQTVTLQFSIGPTPISQQQVALNAQGGGSIVVTPPAAGTWTVSGVGSLARAAAVTTSVAPITTQTVLATPNAAGLGLATTMVATVESNAGTYVPQGTVLFTNPAGGTYGSAPLVATGSGLATATLTWTPTTLGQLSVTATYQPTAGAGGVANAIGSTSNDLVEVLTSVPLVTLRVPVSYEQGEPVTVTALISNPQLTGSAAFLNNTNGTVTSIAGSQPVVNGQVSAPWTPTTLGNQFIITQFSATNSSASGSAQQAIAVQPPGPADPMSIQLAGVGVLRVNQPATVGGGARLAVSSTTGSGAAVNLSESGPCYLQGNVLVTPASNATCVLTASSPGGGTYSANSASFALTVQR